MSRRPARKGDTPATLSVPGVRTLVTEADGDTTTANAPPKSPAARPRKRKPKFVF